MFQKLFSSRLLISLVFAVVFISAQNSHAKSKAEEFEGTLVRCEDVTEPAVSLTCGTDPLVKGKAEIEKEGDVEIVVVGGQPSVTYDVVYRSTDGAGEEPIDTLTTDADGNGKLEKDGFFSLGDVGAGNIVLQRSGLDQFVTGFHVIGDSDDEPEFESGLVRCGEVTRPVALSTCGSDQLKEGKAEIDSEDGDVEVEVDKAEPNATYDVFYRSLDATTEQFIGLLMTDSGGNGKLEQKDVFNMGEIGAGNIVLKRDGSDQFVTGFKVGEKAKRAQKAVVKSSLVRCFDLNQPALANCGTDSLQKGLVTIDEKGQVKVALVGVEPTTTDYQVFFRPINGDSGSDIDTGLVLTTNSSGNANQAQSVFGNGTVGSGNIVIKRGGFDQFVTGFGVGN